MTKQQAAHSEMQVTTDYHHPNFTMKIVDS